MTLVIPHAFDVARVEFVPTEWAVTLSWNCLAWFDEQVSSINPRLW